MATKITNSIVFLHESDDGNRTLTFSCGNINVTVFDGDLDDAAAAYIAADLDPTPKTSKKGKVFFQTRHKVRLEWDVQGQPEAREDGSLSVSGYIRSAKQAPQALATGAFGKFAFPKAAAAAPAAPAVAGLTPEQQAAIAALGIKLG